MKSDNQDFVLLPEIGELKKNLEINFLIGT